jgi:hypothetical protein
MELLKENKSIQNERSIYIPRLTLFKDCIFFLTLVF